jgi:hypothetical protein
MSFKIYNKRGKLSYKENVTVKQIQDALMKKYGDDPVAQSNFRPASNQEELNELYLKYCSTDVEFEELPAEPTTEEKHKEFRDSMKESIKPESPKAEPVIEDDNGFVDPFNDANPIVRDYVMDNNFDKNPESNSSSTNSNFDEPTTFKDAFVMPDNNTNSGNGGSSGGQKKPTKEEPLNPNYNEQGNARKKRSTKKFAKYIVEAVCVLAEKGFVWWVTKDITEAKVVEYELSGEMDLSILLTMPEGQQATVKEWFKMQCFQAETLSKYKQSEKDDLAEVLAELLDKKGISPTIEQEVAIIALKMFGEKFMLALDMKMGIKNVLEQLKELNKGNNTPQYSNYREPENVQQTFQEQPQEQFQQEEPVNSVVAEVEGNFAGMTDIQEATIVE